MADTVCGLQLRKGLGRKEWAVPEAFGPDGWVIRRRDRGASVIVSAAEHDGRTWIHASLARPAEMPSYEDLVLLHRAVFGDGWAYQVFAPPTEHVNIHNYALHLWGRADGQPELPVFALGGSI